MESLSMTSIECVKTELISLLKERYNLDFIGEHREYLDSHLLGAKM